MKVFKLENIGNLDQVSKEIWEEIKDFKIILLEGEMGVGKTTLTSSILRFLGVKDQINSPTYSIVNEYLHPNGQVFYHFDFYRIKNIQEAIDIGTEDYLYSGNVCFIEWAEKIEQLIPDNFIKLNIKNDGLIRYISISK